MPEIAVLILCHRIESTQHLINLLDERFAVFVHVDAKTDLAATPLFLPAHACFTAERFPIFWGGFNMVRAERELLRAARAAHPGLRRYVLVSGDALPVVTLARLEAALLDETVEYMTLIEVANDPALRHVTHEEALKTHHWLQPWRFQNFVLWDHTLTCPRTMPATAQMFGIDEARSSRLMADIHYHVTQPLLRRLPPRPRLFRQFYFGSQWWALSKTAVDLIHDEMFDPDVEEFFHLMEIPDEHFFQCLVGRHKTFLESLGKSFKWHLMFVDHDDPVRHRFGDDALEAERFFDCHAKTGSLFARKFDPARAGAVRDAILGGYYFTQVSS